MSHFLDMWLAFFEGLALVASPCILPILPLILGASVEGGYRRPFGIIAGFILTFTAFAMVSRTLVFASGVDLTLLRTGSLILLGLFGLILIVPSLSARFSALTQHVASIGAKLSEDGREGFSSGLLVGSLIGLVWTPCAGPILAAAIVQIVREESTFKALLLVGSFAVGVGIPMLMIALLGRRVITRVHFLSAHAESIRKVFGVLILLAVGFMASGADIESFFQKKYIPGSVMTGHLIDGVPMPYPAPELSGITAWLNSEPLTLEKLKGKVVLIDFWTYSCINCVRTLPYITGWDKAYRDKGLVIIGVHSPEFEFEKNKANVEAAIAAHHIEYPVALDNHFDTWTNFRNRYWPAHYLINREGQVVYTHFGEGNYAETESNIRYLLGLNPKEAAKPEGGSSLFARQTPETYLGSRRAANFTSPESLEEGKEIRFAYPKSVPQDRWALSGKWRVEGERIISAEAGAKLKLHFTAGKVFLVLGTSTGAPVEADLTLNGAPLGPSSGKDSPNGKLKVKAHTLYELVSQSPSQSALLEIKALSPGLEAYAFTFGP